MAAQMLVQIPVLAVLGWWASQALPMGWRDAVGSWNKGGVSGLLLAVFSLCFWMLPRTLDAAVAESEMVAAKFISVPLLIGLPLGLSWPRMGFVLRGLVVLELIAMLFRLGWLYMVTPVRLCNNYLLDDQHRSGQYMLIVGTILLASVSGKILWGAPPSSQI